MSVLKVEGIKKSYGQTEALKGVSFTVEKGEIFSIMGPNGAGKSTLIECILGTRDKDGGSVKLLGMDPIKQRKEVYSRVGVQFQDMNWRPGIKVKEVCAVTSALYDKDINWQQMLQEFGLFQLADKTVELCSGGERQKLSILLACIHNPEVLFLDELTTGLDPVARREVWDMLQVMNRRGTTIILTSHFMDEVEYLSTRGFILCNGEILTEGPIGNIIDTGRGKNLDEAYINLIGVTK